MEFSINKYEFGQRPSVTLPDPRLLSELGETGIRKMVSDHYDLLSKSEIKDLFPRIDEALEKAKQRSSDFFIQILGGNEYFNQNRGKPMLAQRHSGFKIDENARIIWLKCYIEVLNTIKVSDEIKQSFWNYLNIFSHWMVNTKR